MKIVTTNNFIEAAFNIRKLEDTTTNELKFAVYANNKLLFITDKYGIREIWNQLDYLLKEIE